MNFILENYHWILFVLLAIVFWKVLKKASKKDDGYIDRSSPKREIKKNISFIDLVNELADLLTQFNYKYEEIESSISVLQIIKESQNSPLLVVVLGEFSSGKSTFINALLKEQLLAMKVRPTTATITQLQYGKNPEMYVHYLDGKVEKRPLKDLDLFTVEKYLEDDKVLNEVYYVQLQLENKFLEKIDIADTPGFNSTIERHTEITSEFIAHADVVIWLFDANQMLKGTEIDILEKYCKNFKPIAVINKIDTLGLNDNKAVVEELKGSIERISGFVEHIFPVSAKMALNGQNGEYEQSGMNDIIDYFHSDLIPNGDKTKERMAHIKFAMVANNIATARKEIQKNLEERKRIINEFKIKKEKVENELDQSLKSINNWNNDIAAGKDDIWMLKNIKRYFVGSNIPNDIQNEKKAFLREYSKIEEAYEKINSWKKSIEEERIELNNMYNNLVNMINEYENKFAKNIVDGIFRFFTGNDFTDEKIKINSIVDDYKNWDNKFNLNVDNCNNYINSTNERLVIFESELIAYFNNTIKERLDSKARELKALYNELNEQENYIRRVEREYKDFKHDLNLINKSVFPVFKYFNEHILESESEKTSKIYNDFDSLINHFKDVTDENSDLDWKSLYSRTEIQNLVNSKRVGITNTQSKSSTLHYENLPVNKV